MNDNNSYCGMRKTNYFSGAKEFEIFDREKKIDFLLKET